ncbi:MAG: hypothetical protein ACRDGA_12800 [Bacteroidota bacterium]
MNFFESKTPWVAFKLFLLVSFIVTILMVILPGRDDGLVVTFILVITSQILLLYGIMNSLGFDVEDRADLMGTPNLQGLLLILLGSIATVSIYYFIAERFKKKYQKTNDTEHTG